MNVDEGPDLLDDLPEPDPELDALILVVIGACIVFTSNLARARRIPL